MVHQKAEKPGKIQSLGSLWFCTWHEGSVTSYSKQWKSPDLKLVRRFLPFRDAMLAATSQSMPKSRLLCALSVLRVAPYICFILRWSPASQTEHPFLSWLLSLALLSKLAATSGTISPSFSCLYLQKSSCCPQLHSSGTKKGKIKCLKYTFISEVAYAESLDGASEYHRPCGAGVDSSFYLHKETWRHLPQG